MRPPTSPAPTSASFRDCGVIRPVRVSTRSTPCTSMRRCGSSSIRRRRRRFRAGCRELVGSLREGSVRVAEQRLIPELYVRRNAVVSDDCIRGIRRSGEDRVRTNERRPHAIHVDAEIGNRSRWVSSIEVLFKNFYLDKPRIYRRRQTRGKAVRFIPDLDGAGRLGRCRIAGAAQGSVEEAPDNEVAGRSCRIGQR